MKLVVHELQSDGLVQVITPSRNLKVVAIRPHIYRHNWPLGSLKIEIYDSDDQLVADSDPVNISDIGTENFFHGYLRLFINVGLKKDETYSIYLVGAAGYTFNESAYIGWCNGFDLNKNDMSYEPTSYLHYPLDFEVWERKS